MSNIVEECKMKNKLKDTISSLEIIDLMDYTIDSQTGYRIDEFYRNILSMVLGINVLVAGDEISDGKYRIEIIINGSTTYPMISKGRFNMKDVEETLLDFVICPYLRSFQT